MNCKECTKKMRMILYKHCNNGDYRIKIEELPVKFNCDKKIDVHDDGNIINIVCDQVIHYIAVKKKKLIYGVICDGSPLKTDLKEFKHDKKRASCV
jgi:hypothetical protein